MTGRIDQPDTTPTGRLAGQPEWRSRLEQMVEQHARIAVLEVQCHNDSYQPTPYEANALKNMRHILSRFASDLAAALPEGEETGWRDIASAPKDGTRVLLSDGNYRIVGYWGPAIHNKGCQDEWTAPNSEMWRYEWERYGLAGCEPIGWRPLPPPPSDRTMRDPQ